MILRINYVRLLLCLAVATVLPAQAQETPQPRGVYVIFDASGSMWGQLPDKSNKVTVAKEVLREFVHRDFGDADLALRVYGHRRKGDCTDSELVVPFGPSAAAVDPVNAFVSGLNPLGKTPITYSLRQALTDFGNRQGDIILITDGIETCDIDPCELVRSWKEQGIQVAVHVVGLGLEGRDRLSMQCIADAAGTEYHDAQSAMDLSLGLTAIQEQALTPTEGRPGLPPTLGSAGLWLQGIDEQGQPIRVEGILEREGAPDATISSLVRNQVDAGRYRLSAGVRTANGTLYRSVSRELTVRGGTDTTVVVAVTTPPSVRAVFRDADQEQRGTQVRALQDGREVFSFRWIDEVFVDEGTYSFHAKPNADNDLEIRETLSAGDRKELLFEMVHTVHATITMAADGSGERLVGNYELWQGGAKKYDVHSRNGAEVLPGTYDVHLVNDLIPHVEPGVAIGPDQERQTIDIVVPVGRVTFVYLKADGSRDAEKRVFVGRGPDIEGRVKQSGQVHELIPGTYNAVGWRGNYAKVVFEVRAGDSTEIVLRDRG